MMSEKMELLGKGLYDDIPGQITLKAIPTVSELDYVGSEDFEQTMLDVIFPEAIVEDFNYHKLLEIDFQWICRCLRFLNYGPYFTTNILFCPNCGRVPTEAQVDLRVVDVKPLPANIKDTLVIKKGELIDYNEEIHLHMLTIQESLNFRKDNLFLRPNGEINTDYARICYSISAMGNSKDNTPIGNKLEIENKMSSADFKVLRQRVLELTDYGLRGGGRCQCPKCKSNDAAFVALADDRFFRPTVGDIRKGRDDRSLRGVKNPSGSETATV